MSRLTQIGFELNSTASGVEIDSITGSPTIQTTTVRSGTYAFQANVSATTAFLSHQYAAAGSTADSLVRVYIRFGSFPTANGIAIALIRSAAAGNNIVLRADTNGALSITNEQAGSAQVGNKSSGLMLNVWYRVELSYIYASGAVLGYLAIGDAASSIFATGTANASVESTILRVGVIDSATANIFVDDIAINDTSGTSQNTIPGPEKIIHLKPSAAGDSNGFTVAVGGTAGSSNNFTRVQENTPDDATTYNGAALLNAEDLFNVDNFTGGAFSAINVVAVGARMADLVAGDATTGVKLEIEKTGSGTKSQSANLIPNSTSFKTNAAAAPLNYPLITYNDPDGNPWSQSTLDSMQIGYINDTVGVQTIALSTVWASVAYVPALAGGTTTSTSSTSVSTTSTSISSTSSSTSSTSISTSSTSTSFSTSSTSISTSSTSSSMSSTSSSSTSSSTSSTSSSTSISSTSSSTSSTSTSSTSTSSTSSSTSFSSTSTSYSSTSSSVSSTSASTSSTSTSSTSSSSSTSTTAIPLNLDFSYQDSYGVSSTSLVQSKTGGVTAPSGTIQWNSNTTTGNTLFLAHGTNQSGSAATAVTDSQGNKWVAIQSVTPAANQAGSLWMATNIIGGTTPTITITMGSIFSCDVVIEEWSGLTANPFDVSSLAGPITGTAVNSGTTPLTTGQNEVVIGWATVGNTSSMTVGTGYSNLVQSNVNSTTAIQSKVITATANQSSTMTAGSSSNWVAGVVTLFTKPLPPSTSADLSAAFTSPQYGDVAVDDGDYWIETGSQYVTAYYKKIWTNSTDSPSFTWRGRSTLSPQMSTVYLQIYNFNSSAWETLDTETSQPADTDFVMTGTQSANVSNYYNTRNIVAFRIYQKVI